MTAPERTAGRSLRSTSRPCRCSVSMGARQRRLRHPNPSKMRSENGVASSALGSWSGLNGVEGPVEGFEPTVRSKCTESPVAFPKHTECNYRQTRPENPRVGGSIPSLAIAGKHHKRRSAKAERLLLVEGVVEGLTADGGFWNEPIELFGHAVDCEEGICYGSSSAAGPSRRSSTVDVRNGIFRWPGSKYVATEWARCPLTHTCVSDSSGELPAPIATPATARRKPLPTTRPATIAGSAPRATRTPRGCRPCAEST